MPYSAPAVPSSYRDNDLGRTIYDFVMNNAEQGAVLLEFGCLHGYSSICMAQALRDLGGGSLVGYDLWEEYPYRHSTMQDTLEKVRRHGLQDFVSFEKMNFTDWLKNPTDFDIVHIDVSNNGTLIRETYEALRGYHGEVIFEGGTEERDKVEWMAKFDKEPIVGCGVPYEVLDDRFPALSRMILR